MKIDRRTALVGGGAGMVGAAALLWGLGGKSGAAPGRFEVAYSEADWKQRLDPEQYRVLRGAGTERAGSSPLDLEKREGVFRCAGCALPLFASAAKFDSGTGWPSFYAPLANAVGAREDDTLFTKRTEVHCRRCGGHLGHVFPDGPPPTGLRYCMNGVAMEFVAA
jgi:peptide-methionine (R)-S-oxide reductase